MADGTPHYAEKVGDTQHSLNEPGNNGNEGVLHIPQISKTGVSLSGVF